MRTTALLCLLLTACAGGQPFIVDSSPYAVSVSRARMVGSAGMMQLADSHCARFNRHAEYTGGGETLTSHYRCVD